MCVRTPAVSQSSLQSSSGCSNEIQNLMSIVSYLAATGTVTIGSTSYDFSDFVVDDGIQTFGDASLATKLSNAAFFFMVDMEGTLTGWDTTSQPILRDYVSNGGVLVMTGTNGNVDAHFLNAAFSTTHSGTSSWSSSTVSSVSCVSGTSGAKDNTSTAGTYFANDGSSTVPTTTSATQCIDCSSVTGCTAFYGTTASGLVTEFTVGSGKIIYIGWDYYESGYGVSIPDSWKGGTPGDGSTITHTDCSARTNTLAAETLPLVLQYAKLLSTASPPASPPPPSPPPFPPDQAPLPPPPSPPPLPYTVQSTDSVAQVQSKLDGGYDIVVSSAFVMTSALAIKGGQDADNRRHVPRQQHDHEPRDRRQLRRLHLEPRDLLQLRDLRHLRGQLLQNDRDLLQQRRWGRQQQRVLLQLRVPSRRRRNVRQQRVF